MYGWLFECLKSMIISRYGETLWLEIRVDANVDTPSWVNDGYYPDDIFHKLTRSFSEVVSITEDNAYEMIGTYFIQYLREMGHEKLLRCLGNSLFEYINNMNRLHSHLKRSIPDLDPFDIRCDVDSCIGSRDESTFFLHCRSSRGPLLVPFVRGAITAVAKYHFSKIISMTLVARNVVDGSEECTWLVEEIDDIVVTNSGFSEAVDVDDLVVDLPSILEESDGKEVLGVDIAALLAHEFLSGDSTSHSPSHSPSSQGSQQYRSRSQSQSVDGFDTQSVSSTYSSCRSKPALGLSCSQLRQLFPYHVVFDSALRVLQCGPLLKDLVPSVAIGGHMEALFSVLTPHCSWAKKWHALEAILASKSQFEVQCLEKKSKMGNGLRLSGPISFSDDGTIATFLCSPDIRNVEELYDHGLSVSDLAHISDRLDMVLQESHLKDAMETNRRLLQLTNEVRVEREKSVRLMKEIADKANEALAVKKTFVRYVSHEIRTPLTVAKLGLMLVEAGVRKVKNEAGVEEGDAMSHDIDDTLANIADCESSLDVAVTILDDLLSYEKLESGIYEVFRRMCLGVKFVEDCVSVFAVQAKHKSIDLVFQNNIPASLSDVLYFDIDTKKMSQVVRSFVSNALKFTPVGGNVTVTVSVRADLSEKEIHSMFESTDPGAQLLASTVRDSKTPSSDDCYEIFGVLTVGFSDSGIGIEQDDQEKLFNEIIHFSPDELQAGGGSGLGLWIARSIVHMHHGRVYLHSEGMGKGSTFYVDVPAYRLQQKSPPSTPKRDLAVVTHMSGDDRNSLSSMSKGDSMRSFPPTPPSSPSNIQASEGDVRKEVDVFNGYRVLIVDDAHLILKLIGRILTGRGSVCTTAENGQEAVTLVKERMSTGDPSDMFDCILMDFVMPVMDGPSATMSIRQLGYNGPIVGVTGNMMQGDIDHFKRCGATVVLPKPLLIPDLEHFLINATASGHKSRTAG